MLAKHLHKKLFTKPELIPTRNGYGEGLVEAGKKDKNIVVLCCDLTDSTRSAGFKKAYPDRFVECGVAEQNMMGLAAGMANFGKVPFTASYAAFSPGRNWDQIRVSVCYGEANVKIAAAHAGISVGPDGATHQALEDLASVRAFPNLTIFSPCDSVETKKATLDAAKIKGPVYIRFARSATPVITTEKSSFKPGKAEILRQGKDVSIMATGPLVYEALLAAECLAQKPKALKLLFSRYPAIAANIKKSKQHGHSKLRAKETIQWSPPKIKKMLRKLGKISAEVINVHTLKPFDDKTIAASAKKTGLVITVEEHQIIGGLRGAVAESLSLYQPTKIIPIGMPNSFGESGKPEELLEKYGMTAPWIIHALAQN